MIFIYRHLDGVNCDSDPEDECCNLVNGVNGGGCFTNTNGNTNGNLNGTVSGGGDSHSSSYIQVQQQHLNQGQNQGQYSITLPFKN